ncbi:CE1759 family FMN reductase [Corynebacterium terpenotabidum]|uniref:NADPH-dependent FMN reductase-like domain-containing protein n=1 Tax=Corynebacterium terpenotabidum Y-11 TaxID=1200352 RepID=S4XCA4_9CORY|nr:CE1759 family FMN reductase [Corynebacterium terpenotabidum]AGP30226.1 hypothetical protein A606_02865 [Corynebacterium terpenotabidum Y-11]
MRTLVIVNAGLGDPSTTRLVADRIADATVAALAAAGQDLSVQVVDLRSLAGDLATFMTTFIPTPALSAAQELVTDADAVIAATPVFQGSYSGLFKMFFDTLEMKSLAGVPVTMVATAGTVRHSMVLDFAVRPLLSFLHATVLPTGVFAATGEFGASSGLSDRIAQAVGELAGVLLGARGEGPESAGDHHGAEGGHAAAPEAESDSFTALLARHSGN